MKANSSLFRLASIAALVATCALPFWNTGARIAAADDGGGQTIENVHVTADDDRIAADIDGYVLSSPSSSKLNVEVLSETRAATIEIDAAPIEGISTVIVTMADTAETLVVQNNGWDGTIKINGRQVASWEHLGDNEWKYSNFNRLKNFTSWNVFADTLDDQNVQEAISIFGIIIAVLTFLLGLFGLIVAYEVHQHTVTNTCTSWGVTCAENDYDPTHPACVNYFTECPQQGVFYNWCGALLDQCSWGNQDACDLHSLHCVQ